MKKIMLPLTFMLLLAGALVFPAFALAQDQHDFTLGLSRDFGYSSGTGRIQGTFSMKIRTSTDLAKVVFQLDGNPLAEVTQPPYQVRFNTDSYSLGSHTLRAVGTTTDGQELRSNVITAEFVSASEGWQTALKIVIPLLSVILVAALLGVVLPILLQKGKAKELPLGAPRNYGISGGTICPKCQRPFALHLLSLNLLASKLERCPYCGKWSVVRSRSLVDLHAAEVAELEQAQASTPKSPEDEEERLRKDLEASRYQDS